MKTRIFLLMLVSLFFVACSSSKQTGYAADPFYDNLALGTSKQDITAVLGKDFKVDMNTVTQTSKNYIETLIWKSSQPNVAYVLTFVDGKLSKKNREQVLQDTNGGLIQINR